MFDKITSLDELRKAYRAAAFKAHPDHGGSTEAMQAVNNAYEQRFERLKKEQNARAAADPTGETRTVNEMPFEFREVIEKLIIIPDIVIDLVGCWIWVSGNTKAHKDEIKAAGCFWGTRRKMWYWRCEKDAHHGKASNQPFEWIQAKYGSERITSNGRNPDMLPT